MVRITHFVKKPERRRYSVRGVRIRLDIDQAVFPPSAHGTFFARNITVHRGESVIDIGTGSGFLGILAAKLGGRVMATDQDIHAIDLARGNATLNNVKISFVHGEYFAGIKKKFDVIIANVPQEIVHPNYQRGIGATLTRTISGGPDGNDVLLRFLKIAKRWMHRRSRVYVIVNTVTDYAGTLRFITSRYKVRLVDFSSEPTKEFVADNSSWYKKLNQTGKIAIFPRQGVWYAHEFLLELQLP